MKYFLLFTILFYGGCTNRLIQKRVDTKGIHTTNIHWDANDLQEIAKKAVSSILSSSKIDFSKTYSFGKIRNDSYDHIDTKLLVNKIITALIKSDSINIAKNYKHQNDGVFYGKVSSILKKNDKLKDIYFIFNLSLTDIQTSQIVWSKDIEIRKEYKKELIGW